MLASCTETFDTSSPKPDRSFRPRLSPESTLMEHQNYRSPRVRSVVTPFRSLLSAWLFSALGWSAIFLALGWQMAQDFSIPAADVLRLLGRNWLVWSFATPLVFRFVCRFPIERERWKVALPLHLIACVAFLASLGWLGEKFRPTQILPPPPPMNFRPSFVARLFLNPNFPAYLTIISVSHAFYFSRRGRERGIRAAELSASLAEARLQALRMQIQPHFLFNSLNALGALIQKDTDAAEQMLAVLGDFLRATLEGSAEPEVSLRRELVYVERYLTIEKVRFGQRLKYFILPEEATLTARLPTLLLQPLVENAVRHGIEPQCRDGIILIKAWLKDGFVHILVHDNGAGIAASACEGIGLSNIRSRLREHYGEAGSLALVSDHGTKVEIRLPFHLK